MMNVIHLALGLAIPIAIIYYVTTLRERDPEGFISAYKAGLAIALIVVMWTLIPHVRAFADMVTQNARESRRISAHLHKLSAASLQAAYLEARIVTPKAGLRCTPAERDWDYVCSYMPRPLQSTTRLEFGVIVDETRVVKTSRTVPAGAVLPPPPAQ